MINFQELQDNIALSLEQNKAMSEQLVRMETTVATLCTKAGVEQLEARMREMFAKQESHLGRLDVSAAAASKVIEEVPAIQAELTGRAVELETKIAADIAGLTTKIGARLTTCESELRSKGALNELRKAQMDVLDRATCEQVDKLQSLINSIRDEVSTRVDDIAERSLGMRKELDTNLDSIKMVSEAVTHQIGTRTQILEEDSAQVQAFLGKAEVRWVRVRGRIRVRLPKVIGIARVSIDACDLPACAPPCVCAGARVHEAPGSWAPSKGWRVPMTAHSTHLLIPCAASPS